MPTRVRIQYGRTIQTAPYESLRLDVAIEKDVPEEQTVLEAVNKSVDGLRDYVKAKVAEIMKSEH